MIDPLVSLAFSIQSNKGVYALLLGSGVSRSAQIPTGWEIVLDLIGKLAKLEGEDCEPDPAAWYKDKFGKDPDYSELLDAIARSPAERNQLLKAYFEPDDEERQEGIKLPTAAHKAIAKMVARGYLRVIVTTNFDHLLEKALAEEGIEPTVISTADSVNGALPLVHTNCTIIKVNGDYLDTRIRNTRKELESYEEEINKLLDRVFDEFGLIVCGWSGEWDTALRSGLERCKNHRFTTYWTDIRIPKNNAKKLIELRRGEFILIQNANAFFDELAEKVFVLEEYNKPHPLSVKALVAQVKKYLVDESYEIRLHDLMNQEFEKLSTELLDNEKFPVKDISRDKFEEEFRRQLTLYESITEPILSMMITGCYWGKKSHNYIWIKYLEKLINHPGRVYYPKSRIKVCQIGEEYDIDSKEALLNLKLYPALLLLYGGGIASIAAGKYDFLSNLAAKKISYEIHSLLMDLSKLDVIKSNLQKQLSFQGNNCIWLSNHLLTILQKSFNESIYFDTNLDRYFDCFEYLMILIRYNSLKNKTTEVVSNIIKKELKCARFFEYWDPAYSEKIEIIEEIRLGILREGENWPPVKAGLFDGSTQGVKDAGKFVDGLRKEIVKSDEKF
ncbi:MAG TPA: SIR2 family protein [Methanothrix sp.]|nr:SIR2 family protein [Methanothrix sp.]